MKYIKPILILLSTLAIILIISIVWNWISWEINKSTPKDPMNKSDEIDSDRYCESDSDCMITEKIGAMGCPDCGVESINTNAAKNRIGPINWDICPIWDCAIPPSEAKCVANECIVEIKKEKAVNPLEQKITIKPEIKDADEYSLPILEPTSILMVPEEDYISLTLGEIRVLQLAVAEHTSGEMGSANEEFTPILNADVKAEVFNEETREKVQTLSLRDNDFNQWANVFSDDGVYTSTQPLSGLLSGDYYVIYTVNGKNTKGDVISTKSVIPETYVTVSSGNAFFYDSKTEDEGLDTTGDGKTNIIQVGFWIGGEKEGKYIISADILMPNGETIEESTSFYYIGPSKVNMLIEHPNMSSGAYKVKNVKLFEVKDQIHWVADLIGNEPDGTYTTKEYSISNN